MFIIVSTDGTATAIAGMRRAGGFCAGAAYAVIKSAARRILYKRRR